MNFLGKLILAIDISVLAMLIRSSIRMLRTMKSAGGRTLHVFPGPKLLVGTLLINIFGMVATTYSYFKTFNIIYLLFLSVFLLNTFTVFQRLVSIHENGIIVQGRMIKFKEIRKTMWGEEKKRFVALQLKLRDKDAAPVFISVPLEKRSEMESFLRKKML